MTPSARSGKVKSMSVLLLGLLLWGTITTLVAVGGQVVAGVLLAFLGGLLVAFLMELVDG